MTGMAMFDANSEVIIAFTYRAATGHRINNPHVAVFIEDNAGNLVRTIDLAYQRDESKYLRQLSRWFTLQSRAGSGYIAKTTSGPTRVAGSYSFSWDGRNDAKLPVPQGDYTIHIETARENGPYQIVSGNVTIVNEPLSKAIPGNGDIQAVNIEYRSRR